MVDLVLEKDLDSEPILDIILFVAIENTLVFESSLNGTKDESPITGPPFLDYLGPLCFGIWN